MADLCEVCELKYFESVSFDDSKIQNFVIKHGTKSQIAQSVIVLWFCLWCEDSALFGLPGQIPVQKEIRRDNTPALFHAGSCQALPPKILKLHLQLSLSVEKLLKLESSEAAIVTTALMVNKQGGLMVILEAKEMNEIASCSSPSFCEALAEIERVNRVNQRNSYIVTCGGEGDIRIWTGIEDDEATDKCVGEKAFAVCQRGERLFVGTDANSVQALTFPEVELDGVVARFTAPVVDIDASSDGSILVSASCDMTIGITDMAKATTDVLVGHRAPVLTVALDPKLEYLASSSCDGTVRVWRLADKSEVVSWDCVPKSNSWQRAETYCHAAWTPDGAIVAVPWHDQVRLFQRDTWEKTATLTDSSLTKPALSVVKFSSCGGYLAASTSRGQILVWGLGSHQLVASVQTLEALHICSLDWSPQMPYIAFCDSGGNFGTVDLDVSSKQGENVKRPEDVPMGDPTFVDSDDEDGENVISLDKIKNESGFLTDGLLDDDAKSSVKGAEEDGRVSRQSEARPSINVDLQPPFQPSSTPVSLQYRYMVWNDIGIVKQTNLEEEAAIDVEFHDTGLHHNFRMGNEAGHTLAALSREALVLACEATEENPSKVVCVLLNAWDGTKEWSVVLPGEEEAMCVAAGEGFVAVVTDTRMLRVFTTCGTQREVVSVAGPVVSLAAHKHHLTAVFHSGTGLDGDQCMSFLQLWLGGGDALVRPSCVWPLPLTPRSRLRWLGYTEEGSLCSLDTAGVLRKLTPSSNWAPICNVDEQCKGKSDHYFVVGICERFQTVRGVLCKGAFFPPTFPRPTVTEVSWTMPLCETSVEKGELEEQFWRCSVALPALADSEDARDSADRTIKKTLLKLFALACQSGLEVRAVGLCQLMSSEVVQLAVKYASKLGRTQLANRIEEAVNKAPPSPPPDYRYEDNIRDDGVWREPSEDRAPPPLSQDLFAPSAEESAPEMENPILALKQSKSTLAPTRLSNPMKRANPFKKKSEDKIEDKGLAGLTKQALSKPQAKASEPLVAAKKSTANENQPKKTTFSDWFAIHKESLQEEYPDLDSSELSKVGLKRFKEEQKTKPNNSQGMKKFFGSTTLNNENKIQKDSTPQSNGDTESKKRKVADEEDEIPQTPEPKKASTVSKLKKFSFVKP